MGTPRALTDPDKIVILFDGVCNLCNGAVQFIVNRDSDSFFRFASLQSSFGAAQLTRFGLNPNALHSIMVIEHDILYQRSDAILKIAAHLNGWRFLRIFRILPPFIRDGVYNLIASNRYRMFGKKDSCMIPTPALKARFLE